MAIKIKKNGKIKQFTLHSTDVKVLDLEGKFKKKDLESVIREISDTEHIHIGEVDTTKDGVWIDDGEILDNADNNGVVERLKTFVNETIGELSNLTTSIKSNIVGAINELKGNVDQLSNPNLVINPDFRIWQRGETFNTVNNGQYTADRWNIATPHGGLDGVSVSKVENGIRIRNTSDKHVHFRQFIDGKDYTALNQEFTLSVKIKGKEPKTISGVVNGAKSISSTDGNFIFVVACNSSLKTVNVEIVSNANDWIVEWVKLELGSVATPFVPRLMGEELVLCKRYYESSSNFMSLISPYQGALQGFNFEVEKRISPTMTFRKASSQIYTFQAWAGNEGFSDAQGNYNASTKNVLYIDTLGDSIKKGNVYITSWVADSEIY